MRKLANGLGIINRLISRLTAAKGGVLAVAVTLALIAVAGVGFASLRGSAPTKSVADSAPTATAPGATTPTVAAPPTPTPPPVTPPPVTPPTPSPTVATKPQLSVNPTNILEPNGCGPTKTSTPSYFQNGFTVKNAGGGTLTWQIPATNEIATSRIQFTTWGGSLAAGRSQYVQMFWIPLGSAPGNIPPTGGFPFTITSNGGPDQQMWLNCA